MKTEPQAKKRTNSPEPKSTLQFSVFDTTCDWCSKSNVPAEFFEEIASTNSYAKSQTLKPGQKIKAFVARAQTQGRGRGENTWADPLNDSALFISWLMHLEDTPKTVTGPLIGLAVYRALLQAWPEAPFYLKAPNDIYLNSKKICGILAEATSMGKQHQLTVGIGLNVWSHPQNIETAGALSDFAKVSIDSWNSFLSALHLEISQLRISAQGTHLTESKQTELIEALNKNPELKYPYISISPYGDLATEIETISWRHI